MCQFLGKLQRHLLASLRFGRLKLRTNDQKVSTRLLNGSGSFLVPRQDDPLYETVSDKELVTHLVYRGDPLLKEVMSDRQSARSCCARSQDDLLYWSLFGRELVTQVCWGGWVWENEGLGGDFADGDK